MKKRKVFFLIYLFSFKIIFSQAYFFDVKNFELYDIELQKVDLNFYQKKIDDHWNNYFNDDLLSSLKPKHDRTKKELFYYESEKDLKKHKVYIIKDNKLKKEEAYKIENEESVVLCCIDDGKALLSVLNEKETYYIYDLNNRCVVKKIKINKLQEHLYKLIDLRKNIIFFDEFYYDLELNKVNEYAKPLKNICIDETGDRIVGLDKYNYITILNLKTGEIINTKIKRKFNKNTLYNNTSLYYLEGNNLYYTKLKVNIGYGIEAMFSVYAKEQHQWYKLDLVTGKTKKIKQPSLYVDLL